MRERNSWIEVMVVMVFCVLILFFLAASFAALRTCLVQRCSQTRGIGRCEEYQVLTWLSKQVVLPELMLHAEMGVSSLDSRGGAYQRPTNRCRIMGIIALLAS
jgi:hypothetical protein